VFLPTTPNPTSGFLLFVPAKDLYVLDMTIEEGAKMVISGGLVTPPDRRPAAERAKKLIGEGHVDVPEEILVHALEAEEEVPPPAGPEPPKKRGKRKVKEPAE